MKKLLLSLLLTLPFFLAAQQTRTEYRTTVLSEQRTLYLNGGLRSVAGGQSKVNIPIDLPANTVEWYYSFSTAAGQSGTQNLNLAIQLSSLLVDPTGTAAKIISKVRVPSGASEINVYLLDAPNRDAFMGQWELLGGDFAYVEEGSVEKTKQGVVRVDDVTSGRVYLGLDNPSTLDGVEVVLEIVALTRHEVYLDEWSTENLLVLKEQCKNYLYSNLPGKVEVCDCFTQKLVARATPAQWERLRKAQPSFYEGLLDSCFTSTGFLELGARENSIRRKQNEIDALIRAAYAAADLRDFAAAKEQLAAAIALLERHQQVRQEYSTAFVVRNYNALARYCLLNQELTTADTYLRKALALDNDNPYLWANIAHWHLLSGRADAAKAAYQRYGRREKLPDGDRWAERIAADLRAFEAKGLPGSLFSEVRELLRIRD